MATAKRIKEKREKKQKQYDAKGIKVKDTNYNAHDRNKNDDTYENNSVPSSELIEQFSEIYERYPELSDIYENNIKPHHNSLFNNVYIPMVYNICKETGATDAQLANIFGIARKTIYRWMNKEKDFKEQIQKGRDYYNTQGVEKALMRIAQGYEYKEIMIQKKSIVFKESKAAGALTVPAVEITERETIKTQKPDTVALMFFLQNRSPDRWKDQRFVKHEGNVKYEHMVEGVSVPKMLDNIPVEELKKIEDEIREAINRTGTQAKSHRDTEESSETKSPLLH